TLPRPGRHQRLDIDVERLERRRPGFGEQLVVDRLLAGEVRVDRTVPDPDGGGDLAHGRRLEPLTPEQLQRRLQHPIAGSRPVTLRWAPLPSCHSYNLMSAH